MYKINVAFESGERTSLMIPKEAIGIGSKVYMECIVLKTERKLGGVSMELWIPPLSNRGVLWKE